MNKFFILLLLLLVSCNNKAQDSNNIKLLQKAYVTKDEKVFLENFPENFKNFKSTFGWNDKLDKPNVLYDVSNQYIDYLFELASEPKFNSYKKKIINIAIDGKWEADGVGYFRHKLHALIETDKEFILLLNNLNENNINSFWRFYFDAEDLIYSPKLEVILDKSMKSKAMLVFKKLKKERKSENTLDHIVNEYEIFDEDGYVNLRKEKNKSSAIIERVNNEENIEILNNTGDWWYVETKTGNIGYVYKTRIRMKNNNSGNDIKQSNKISNDCVLNNLLTKFNLKIEGVKFEDEEEKELPIEAKITVTQKIDPSKKQEIIFTPSSWFGRLNIPCKNISYFNKKGNLNENGMYDDKSKNHDLVVADYNFDGLEDFAYLWDVGSNVGSLFSYFIQNKDGKFVIDKSFPLQEGSIPDKIDVTNRTLTVGSTIFQLDKNNKWKIISSK